MKGIENGSSFVPSPLKGLAIKLKNYKLEQQRTEDPGKLKQYFSYWKAKEFLEAEPDFTEGQTPLAKAIIEEECKRRGIKTRRENIRYNENGNLKNFNLYIYPFSLGQIKVTDYMELFFLDYYIFMQVPQRASVEAVFDVLERLDKHLEQCLATEWVEIERRAAKLAKKAELSIIADKVTGKAEIEAAERTELLEEFFGNSGFQYEYNDRYNIPTVQVQLFKGHAMQLDYKPKTAQKDIPYMHDLAVQLRHLMTKYSDMCSTRRVVLGRITQSAMVKGRSAINMQLPHNVKMSFEIEDAKFDEQYPECCSFAQEFIAIMNSLEEKHGYNLKKLSFDRSFEMRYSNRHYLPNKDKFSK